MRIGQIVTTDTEQEALNLLDRRNLVGGLINWLLHCSPKAPPKPAAASAQSTSNRDGSLRPATPQGANGKDDPKAQDKTAAHSNTVAEAKQTIQPLVMDRLDIAAASQLPRDELSHQLRDIVTEILNEEKLRLNGPEQTAVVELLLDDMLGLGPLEPLLADDSITDIMVNGPYQTYIERAGKLEATDVKFRNNEHVLNIARRIVSIIGRRVDETSPLVDARLMDGSRVNIIIPPLAIDGPAISIR
ncbi:MAG: ATPase, T2SS/T4P/T4SS family, partial [Kiloniellales bacterium]